MSSTAVFAWYIELSWKPSCSYNGPVLREIHRIRVNRQNIQTDVVKSVIDDTAVANTLLTTSRQVHGTLPDHLETAPLRWRVVRPSMQLWFTPDGPVLDMIRRILHAQTNRTGVVNTWLAPKIGLILDTGIATTLLTTPRHVRGTHPGSARRGHGCLGTV